MNEILQEFVDSRGVEMRVDRAQGIIRGVKLLGLHSRNGRKYLPTALAEAAGLYEGAKVNVNHPKGNPLAARDYQDRLGSIRNVSAKADGLYGDFHFNPKHALAEQLAWDATHAPENVGFSHNVEARTSRQANQTVVEAILKVQSVDLVADPATTRGLYESAATHAPAPAACVAENARQWTLEQFRAERPDLVAAIEAEATAGLRSEVDRLRASEAVHARRSTIARLLKEFKLPDPQTLDAATRPMVSELFLETLVAAPDERTMRALVQERAEMIAAAQKLDGAIAGRSRPVSREQNPHEATARRALDARQFARAIS